jgi:hypothetical protein
VFPSVCGNPSCFNPEHLRCGTRKQAMNAARRNGRLMAGLNLNVRRRVAKARKGGKLIPLSPMLIGLR